MTLRLLSSRAKIAIATAGLITIALVVGYRIFNQSPAAVKEVDQSRLVISGSDAGYVDSSACAGCHRQIWDSYQLTGMGRSWSRIQAGVAGDFEKKNTFYHPASDRYYTMYSSAGKYYQRRHQLDKNGKAINLVEREIHYVVGSGNHARNYLHRTSEGRLLELPVAWYAEKGGYWAMNPGFDNSHHFDFRRQLSYECVFCHTGYPEIALGGGSSDDEPLFPGRIPEGIDCQRCHGPGKNHIQAAASGDRAATRAAIVNPGRLSPERQLEVCMQCHLESTSARLPNRMLRFDRNAFSYRPGDPLADFALHFDHEAGTGHDDKFEIAHQAYRFRKSACFLKSEGRLTCTTCHNPHESLRGDEAVKHHTRVCLNCHAQQLQSLVRSSRHTAESNCLSCHMPKRRTEDVVHVVMTDHYIQRNKPNGDLLSPLRERPDGEEGLYKGPVVLYYPSSLPSNTENELYLALAQVKQSNNLKEGILRLETALQKQPSAAAEFYYELARAYVTVGRDAEATRTYQEAIRRKADYRLAWLALGRVLSKSAQQEQAVEALEKGAHLGPEDATVLNDLGLSYLRAGRSTDALRALKRAVILDPHHTEAHNSLGNTLQRSGNSAGAEQAYRDALRAQPDFVPAQLNLAKLLVARGDSTEFEDLYKRVISAEPKNAVSRYEYALALAGRERYDQARQQFEVATRLDPALAEAQAGLADMLALEGRIVDAAAHYRQALALKSELGTARLGLASVLDAQGRRSEAISHLELALRSSDASVRRAAQEGLQSLRPSSGKQ